MILVLKAITKTENWKTRRGKEKRLTLRLLAWPRMKRRAVWQPEGLGRFSFAPNYTLLLSNQLHRRRITLCRQTSLGHLPQCEPQCSAWNHPRRIKTSKISTRQIWRKTLQLTGRGASDNNWHYESKRQSCLSPQSRPSLKSSQTPSCIPHLPYYHQNKNPNLQLQCTLTYLLSVSTRFSKTDRGVIRLISSCDSMWKPTTDE